MPLIVADLTKLYALRSSLIHMRHALDADMEESRDAKATALALAWKNVIIELEADVVLAIAKTE